MGAFALLAVTGVLLMHAFGKISATLITFFFRNMNNARSIHDAAAVLYTGLMVVHIGRSLYNWFVKSDPDILVPARSDFGEFVKAAKYLVSRTASRPAYGRYSAEQKLTYWTVVAFSILMLLTALIQALQSYLVPFMPDAVLPIVRVLHRSIGLLAVVTLLPWHLYHTLLKERNFSIFRGVIDEPTIQREHPLELQQIDGALAAYQTYRKTQTTAVKTAPVSVTQVAGGRVENAGAQGQK
jgi:cytochrome b subunit of formate dehydrogenase